MKRYESYKRTKAEWMGSIPSHWNSMPLLPLLRGKITDGPHETPTLVDKGIPFISVDSLNDSENIDFSVVKKFISEEDYQVYSKKTNLETGDILFSKSATIGKTAIVGNERYMVWSPIAIIKPGKTLYNKFLYYVLSEKRYIEHVRLLGSFNTQANVGMREIERSIIPCPPILEQETIAAFLDYKVGQIDKSISEIDSQIESLKAYRQSVISEAVTKGLDKNAKMKDSGIEWIGEIPEGWSIVPLKHYLSLKGRIGWNGLKSEEFKEYAYAYLVTGQDFNSAIVNWSKCYQIDKERYDEDPFIQLKNGDILVTKDGTIGKIAKVSNLDKPACLNSGIFVVKQKKEIFVQDYLYWVFVSNQLKEFVQYNSTGSTIQHLYQNVFENMPLTLPSIEEQDAIASYLNEKTSRIDEVINALDAQRTDLNTLKQAIISEAVTGKIDVRDWTPSVEQ